MKKFLIYYGVIVVILTSCESNSSEGENEILQEPNSTNLVESTTLFDGEEITIYTDEDKGEIYVMEEGNLKNIDELTESGNMGYYVSTDFDGVALFSTKEKLNEVLEGPDKLIALNQKMNVINPFEKETSKSQTNSHTGSSAAIDFQVATASYFNGNNFSIDFGLGTQSPTYSNPHLRCNQYETNCIDFNDKISSIKVANSTAEFYTGSFQNFGSWLYVNAQSGIYTKTNLNTIGWNDKITSFWASDAYRASKDISGFSTVLGSCSHNYNDPLCP